MLSALSKLLSFFQSERHRDEDRVDSALAALYAALNETLLYTRRPQAEGRSGEKEAELSRFWFKAAHAVRRVDSELAERCLVKGMFWVSPDDRPVQYIVENQIDLESIFDDVRSLMRRPA